jgi:hypothetical protein
VTYNDPSKKSEKSYSDHQFDQDDPNIVVVADFTINIDKISKQQLISMRKFLPSEEYRLLKNRKSARLCRKKRKEERGDMQQQINQLVRENMMMKEKLAETERLLKESQSALLEQYASHG